MKAAGVGLDRGALADPLAGDSPWTRKRCRFGAAIAKRGLVGVDFAWTALDFLFTANGTAYFPHAIDRDRLLAVFIVDGALGMQLPGVERGVKALGALE